MKAVKLYGTDTCGYCGAARMLLTRKGVAYEDIAIANDPALRAEMQRLSGRTSVPQIFIGDHHVGGFDDLYALEQAGKLDDLLSAE